MSQNVCVQNLDVMCSLVDIGVGGQGSEFPASCTVYSWFLPPTLVVPAAVCFFYCEILRNVAKFISYFSRIPPPWVSSLLSPVHFPPPLLPGSCPPVPLHSSGNLDCDQSLAFRRQLLAAGRSNCVSS